VGDFLPATPAPYKNSKKRPDLKGITTYLFYLLISLSLTLNSKKRPDLKGITTLRGPTMAL